MPLPTLVLLTFLARLPAPSTPQSSADEQYRFLAGLVEKGMHELAVDEAKKFVRAYPDHAKAALARYRLAGALWELGRHEEAAGEYETLSRAEGFEYRAECLFRCGEAALARGDEARANQAYEAVLGAGQDYLVAPALFALAEAAFRAKRFDEAEQRYQELVRSRPDCEQAPLAQKALVWCSFQRGDAAEATKRARAFLKREKDPARADEVRLVLAETLLAADPKSALATYRSVATKEQQDARARGEGFALAALGDHAGAAEAFERVFAETPESRYAHEAALQAGIERLRAGDPAGAVQRLNTAARDGDPETLYWLAQAQKGAGDARGALSTLDQALRRKPADELVARIHGLRGDCLTADGRREEALAAYEKSGSDQALYAAAVAALNQGDAAGATRLAERILRADPDGPRAQGARVVVAEALFASKKYAEAERAAAVALEHPSDEAEAARLASRLAWCPYLSGDLETAEQRFAELAQRRGEAPEIEEALAMQARIRMERGDASGTELPARRYLQRFPQGRFLDQVLLALARAAKGAEAESRFEELLQRCPSSPLAAGARLELADLQSKSGAHADAASLYAEVQRASPGTREAARAGYGIAWCAWEQEDYAGCERALAQLLADREASAELVEPALELALWAQLKQGQRERAIATWRALAARKGDEKRRFEAARAVVAAQREAKELPAAKKLLDECLRGLTQRELVAAGQIEAAYLALDAKDFAAADVALAAAKKSGADAARVSEAVFDLGDARFAAGDEEGALPLFEAAARSESGRSADALYKLGFVRLSRGELGPAEEALTVLLERHPENELACEARFLLGECAYRAGDMQTAAQRLREALTQARGELRAKALFRAGLALGRLERWNESEAALGELASSFADFPNLAEAELWRGRALVAQKKTRAARAAFERTLSLDQGELAAGARLGIGRLLEAEGKNDDALSEYLKVALLYAHDESVAEALYRAGAVLERLGQPAQASQRYRELCDEHASSQFVRPARERLLALQQEQ